MTFRLISPPSLDLEPDRPPVPGAVRVGDDWHIDVDGLDDILAMGPVIVRPIAHTDILPTIEVMR